jgi:hypothetical protein
MSSLVELLQAKLTSGESPVKIVKGHRATEILEDPATKKLKIAFGKKNAAGPFDRIILALPKVPLKKLIGTSYDLVSTNEPHIHDLLECAVDFPMVKVFVVVKDRWWGNQRMANRYATRVPTRELHYWPARLSKRYGMIMLYTDRPATAFWSNYVPPGPQEDVSYKDGKTHKDKTTRRLPAATEARLLDKIVQYLNENNLPEIKRTDIIWYGIRDWGREPYGGANHVWRPERRYWKVMARLGEIGIGSHHVHICGEAYSDYHGFIEGALRSAVYASHRILDRDSRRPRLGWLKDLLASAHSEGSQPGRTADQAREASLKRKKEKAEDNKYFAALQDWASSLDRCRSIDRSFLTSGERPGLQPPPS